MKKSNLSDLSLKVERIINAVYSNCNAVHECTIFEDDYAVVVFDIENVYLSSYLLSKIKASYWQISKDKLYIHTKRPF